jgi:hypothetical protein
MYSRLRRFTKTLLRFYQNPIAAQVVGQLDQTQAGGTWTQDSGGHHHQGLHQHEARRAVHPAKGATSNHAD